jgi:hypothetical protein
LSRRFSDQPVNLIHRIPTPDQISATRPVKRTFSQNVADTMAGCVRAVLGFFSPVKGPEQMPEAVTAANDTEQDYLDQYENELITERLSTEEKQESATVAPLQSQKAVETQADEGHGPYPNIPQASVMPETVQPEEVAELRGYLLTQQQDIVRLSAQIQELKSMVVAQQQVLGYLGRELDAGDLSSLSKTVATASTTRNRPVRQKANFTDKVVVQREVSEPSSLSF